MILNIILFAIGLAVSIYGADFLVRGSSSIAKKSGLSPLFIGLTIVAFGTSMPELVVNLFASFKGNNDIAIGNILGSNIANILLILGISSVIYPLTLKKTTIAKEIPFSFLAVLVLFILANDTMMDGLQSSLLSRGDGLVLLGFFVIFMYYTFGISRVTADIDKNEVKIYKYHIAFLMIIGGLLGLVIGGNLLVDSAIALARFLRVSEAFIGLTIVAVGTSLPELATSAVAAFRKSSDIAVGNIVGSNIFNIFWILGISSIIHPIPLNSINNFDILVCFLATVLLFIFMYTGKKNTLERWQGIIFIGIYTSYLSYLVIRG